MNIRNKQIGFSQRVKLEWVEQTANLVLAGNDKEEAKSILRETLKDKVSVGSEAERGNREKIITILLKIWLTTPTDLHFLRNSGLELLKSIPRNDQFAIHWGMVMAVYPFWAAVAGQVGRLLKLQGSAAAGHVQRRLREQYGERETVSRAARRVIRSYKDWGVLSETPIKGIYTQCSLHSIEEPKLISWLIEAFLTTQLNGSGALKEIMNSSVFFPFHVKQITPAKILEAASHLEIIRYRLDDDIVILGKKEIGV